MRVCVSVCVGVWVQARARKHSLPFVKTGLQFCYEWVCVCVCGGGVGDGGWRVCVYVCVCVCLCVAMRLIPIVAYSQSSNVL
jgi:hypothetical protein